MRHLGDISKVNGAEIEPVDILTFGSPCQDLSVAGKRAGLKHEANGDEETTRSGLFMEAVRIIKEMREATDGIYPRFALWENVPGAFSSNKDEDFRIVCEELIKIVEPSAIMPAVPQRGWPYADSYVGDGWSLAYRVFDAQYWGVPQRRRRIHLVADFRGERAREVLFEREGVRGYFAEGRTPWQTAPADAQRCAGADDREGESDGGRGLDAVAYSFDSLASNSMKSSNPHSGCRPVEVAKCLDTTDPNPSKNQGGIAIVEPIPYTLKIRSGCEGGGKGALVQEDKSATLATNGLTNPIVYTRHYGGRIHLDGVTPTLEARAGTGGNNQPIICLQGNGIDRADTAGCNGKGWKEGTCYTLNTIDRPAIAYQDVVGALCLSDYKGVGNQYISDNKAVIKKPDGLNYIVRRLTPTECARLQGFPDRWGDIEEKKAFTDEEFRFWHEVRNTHAAINGKKVQDYTEKQMLAWYSKLHTDSAEYKMWGNGIALPPALYCMQGMVEALSTEEEDAWML